jgi:release factor glutamine methyltransferase
VDVLFHGRSFAVDPGLVMAPRPATEALADAAARVGGRAATVVDVGTGSGALAVTIALLAPLAEIWATDVSPHAVEAARRNAARHGVARRVLGELGDLLDPVPHALDLVVANLPYLPDSLCDPRYAEEPAEAIYGPGDGLVLYRRLLGAARERLAPGGALLIQLHREVLAAERDELDELRRRLLPLPCQAP